MENNRHHTEQAGGLGEKKNPSRGGRSQRFNWKWSAGGLLLVVVLIIAACGSNQQPKANNDAALQQGQAVEEPGNKVEEKVEEKVGAEAGKDSTWPVSITHALGTTTIESLPERVVVMDFRYVEELVALGIAPVGISDVAGYERYMDYAPELTASAADVGKRSEPNLEVITSLQPDLIIGNASFIGENYDLLKSIAPTLAFDPFPEQGLNQFEEMTGTFLTVASAFGKTAEAQHILTELDDYLNGLKQKLASHGKEGSSFVLGLLMNGKTATAIKLYTANAQAPQILEKMGLKAAYHSEEGAGDGSVNTTVESLIDLQEADFIYMMMAGQENVYEDQYKDNAVWNSLKFVEEGRAYPMERYIWMFGGPTTAKVFADTVVRALINE